MDAVFRHGYPAFILIGALAAWSSADSINRGSDFSHQSLPPQWQLIVSQNQSCGLAETSNKATDAACKRDQTEPWSLAWNDLSRSAVSTVAVRRQGK